VTLLRVYLNKFDAPTYELMFDLVQKIVKELTGRSLAFKCLQPGGNLLAMNVDMEFAQVQGFGASILKTNDQDHSGIKTRNPDKIVQYIVKLCHVHAKR